LFNRRDENTQHGVPDDAILQPTACIPNDEYDLFHAIEFGGETWNGEYRTPPVWFQNSPNSVLVQKSLKPPPEEAIRILSGETTDRQFQGASKIK
jgi:hypothetical protein